MIGWLRGTVVEADGTSTTIDVHGVGYLVHVATGDFTSGADVALYIHTAVRADAIVLYGFATARDREFFELLLATPGVGPSTALGALRTMSLDELAHAIDAGDVKKVATISGIGPKTASRIVLELKGKVVAAAPVSDGGAVPEVISEALRSLGYGASEIRRSLADLDWPDDEASALRLALSHVRNS